MNKAPVFIAAVAASTLSFAAAAKAECNNHVNLGLHADTGSMADGDNTVGAQFSSRCETGPDGKDRVKGSFHVHGPNGSGFSIEFGAGPDLR